MGRCFLVVVLTVVAFPSVARAASAQIETGGGRGSFFINLVYAADPGEANAIEVSGDRRVVRISDPGAAIRTADCEQEGEHAVVCTSPSGEGFARVIVRAADRSDRVVSELGAEIELGAGDDVGLLTGDGVIDGGGGLDVMVGREGMQTIVDGDISGMSDADVIDGGAGSDVISYAARTRGVRVNLAANGPQAGEPGEGDRVTQVESAVGGSANDWLSAGTASAALIGGAGRDRLDGGPGADGLQGGTGTDWLRGHDGNDWFEPGGNDIQVLNSPGQRSEFSGYAPNDRAVDIVQCGAGRDHVAEISLDTLFPDCDVFHFRDQVAYGYPRAITGRSNAILTFAFGCTGCRWQLEARVATGRYRGRLVGRAYGREKRFRESRQRAWLRLNSTGKTLLRRHRCFTARVRVQGPQLERLVGSGLRHPWFAYRYVVCRPGVTPRA